MTHLLARSLIAFLFVARGFAAEPLSNQAASSANADVILLNGNIYTLESQPKVEALAIKGERITFAGSDEEVRKYVAAETRVIDLNGRTVLPGFTDAHIHPIEGGLIALDCDFRGAKSLEAISAVLSKYASKHPEKAWIRGANMRLM